MDELTTSIVGIEFTDENKSKINRRMEIMLCAPSDVVELRLEPKNPFDANAVAISSDRDAAGLRQRRGCALIGKRVKEDEATAVFQGDARERAYIWIRLGGGLPTLPDPVPDVPKPDPPRQMRPVKRRIYDPHAFYPEDEGLEFAG